MLGSQTLPRVAALGLNGGADCLVDPAMCVQVDLRHARQQGGRELAVTLVDLADRCDPLFGDPEPAG